jgi:hypothetical protein
MVVVNGDLWIANKDIGGVTVVDLTTGQISIVIVIVHPIGMHYDRKVGKVFVGSKRSHWGGAVFAIDPGTMKVTDKYWNRRMDHPSGIATYGDELYVAELNQGHVLKFSISTTEFLGTAFETESQPEQIILSNC